MNKSISETISEKIKARMLSLLEEKPPEEKKPTNIGLTVAWMGFNFIYLFLDIGTSYMVGSLTNPFYGVMTFFAGIAPFMVYEILFVRAYNSRLQKWLSVSGAAVSIISTVTLALITGGINAILLFGSTIVTLGVLEVALLAGLILGVSVHGVLLLVYFFGDDGIAAVQTRTRNQAEQVKRSEKMAFAEKDVTDILAMAKKVDEYEKNNVLEVLAAVLEKYGISMNSPVPTMRQNSSDVNRAEVKDNANRP